MSLPNDPRTSLSREAPRECDSAKECNNIVLFTSLSIDDDIEQNLNRVGEDF
jgi:hypothetical protein